MPSQLKIRKLLTQIIMDFPDFNFFNTNAIFDDLYGFFQRYNITESILLLFSQDLHRISAIAVLNSDGISGEISFSQHPAGPVHIKGNITGLSPGKHGLHIHHSGDLRNGCEKLGSHFNPYFVSFGGV